VNKRKVPFLSPFYSYPAALVAQWCGVSYQTARAYKNGSKRPSRSVLKLFRLHAEGRVLGDGWEGWRVDAEAVFDDLGNRTTRAQLEAYWIIMQYAAELARDDRATPYADGIRALLRRA
jgi:hypothetical protein